MHPPASDTSLEIRLKALEILCRGDTATADSAKETIKSVFEVDGVNLFKASNATKDALIDKGAIELLLQSSVALADQVYCRQVNGIFSALVYRNPGRCAEFLKRGGHFWVLGTMEAIHGDERLLHCNLLLLSEIGYCVSDSQLLRSIAMEVAEKVMDVVEQHAKSPILFAVACSVLSCFRSGIDPLSDRGIVARMARFAFNGVLTHFHDDKVQESGCMLLRRLLGAEQALNVMAQVVAQHKALCDNCHPIVV